MYVRFAKIGRLIIIFFHSTIYNLIVFIKNWLSKYGKNNIYLAHLFSMAYARKSYFVAIFLQAFVLRLLGNTDLIRLIHHPLIKNGRYLY